MKKEEIRMKHYRICIQAGRHEFEHLSSTISEAYGAIEDASIALTLRSTWIASCACWSIWIEGTLLRRIGIPSGSAWKMETYRWEARR